MTGPEEPLEVAALDIYHGNTPVQPGGLFAPDRPRAPGFDHLIAGVSPASTSRENTMSTDKTTLRDRILVALRTGAKTNIQLMKAAGGSSGAVSTACKKLRDEGRITKPDGASVQDPWHLADGINMPAAPTTSPGRAASKKTRGPYKVKAKRRSIPRAPKIDLSTPDADLILKLGVLDVHIEAAKAEGRRIHQFVLAEIRADLAKAA